jgi:hypothetical protein
VIAYAAREGSGAIASRTVAVHPQVTIIEDSYKTPYVKQVVSSVSMYKVLKELDILAYGRDPRPPPSVSQIRAVLESTLQVATLRDAVRVLEPELAGGGTPESKMRRVERLFRAEVST